MNVAKLLSNVEFEVREKIQTTNTDLKALWISDWAQVAEFTPETCKKQEPGTPARILKLPSIEPKQNVFCFGLHSLRGTSKTDGP